MDTLFSLVLISTRLIVSTGRYIPIDTPEGVVYAMCAKRTEVGAASVSVTMPIEKAHRLLGHHNEEATRKVARHLG
jgi:hypothetical protein